MTEPGDVSRFARWSFKAHTFQTEKKSKFVCDVIFFKIFSLLFFHLLLHMNGLMLTCQHQLICKKNNIIQYYCTISYASANPFENKLTFSRTDSFLSCRIYIKSSTLIVTRTVMCDESCHAFNCHVNYFWVACFVCTSTQMLNDFSLVFCMFSKHAV